MIDSSKNLDIISLNENISDLAQQVIDEPDLDKTRDLVALFNWNMSKKNVARLLKLNNLYDAVSDQMIARFEKRSDQFSNAELLDYLKTVQGAIDSSSKSLSTTEEPPVIVQNNTQINVNLNNDFDRAAKARIAAAVQAILTKASDINSAEFEDKTDTSSELNSEG